MQHPRLLLASFLIPHTWPHPYNLYPECSLDCGTAHLLSNLILWVRKLEAWGISCLSCVLCLVCSAPQQCVWAGISAFEGKGLGPTTVPAPVATLHLSSFPVSFPVDNLWGLGPCTWGSAPLETLGFRSWDWGNGAASCVGQTCRPSWDQQLRPGSREPKGWKMPLLGSFTAAKTDLLLALVPLEHHEAGKARCVTLGKFFHLLESLQGFSKG